MADETRTETSDEERLLSFLRNRDVPCPLCRYNLRDLTTPVCPECGQQLELSVGVRHMVLGWYIATLTPMTFSGICAIFLGTMIFISFIAGQGIPPPEIFALDAFGLMSGFAAVILLRKRLAFLRLPNSRQRDIAFGVWSVHALALAALLLYASFS